MTRKISSHTNTLGRELQDRPDKVTLCIDVNEEKRDFNAEKSLPPE